MKKVKRPFKKINRLCFGRNFAKKIKIIKKPYIEDGELYLGGGKRKKKQVVLLVLLIAN